ncbi:MAG: hypothetical protein HND49_16750 [Planctomycetes bacterium]|nr:hypothetical protein [Planctomycetota bacterium]
MRIPIITFVCLAYQLLHTSPAFANESVQKILITNVHVFNGIDKERQRNG